MNSFIATLSHDQGKSKLTVSARDMETAIQQIMEAEKCPRRAIIEIHRIYNYQINGYGVKWPVIVEKSVYDEHRQLALSLTDSRDDSHFAYITAYVFTSLEPNEICVKDHNENEGMMDWLIQNGIATWNNRVVQSGFVSIPVMQLTPQFMQENNITTTINIPQNAEI